MLEPREAIDRISAVFRGPHPGSRALHAKGSFFTGTFTATPEAAGLCRAAVFSGPPVPVLVRWSNGSGHPRNKDTGQDVRGMAVSFRPDLATADGATDLLGQTAPRFPVRTPEAFVAFTEAVAKPATLPLFLARHPAAGLALLANTRARATAPPRSYAEATYFPIHAYGWTSPDDDRCWVRYTLAPLGGPADRPEGTFEGRERLREEIRARLAQGAVRFDLRVTVAAPGDDPDDPMSVWKGSRELSAGVVEVTAEDPARETHGDLVVFDPTRVVDGITLSDDPILHYRAAAYSESAARRAGTG